MIAFVGSVFSPYYHWAGRRNPEEHCAVNVAVYGAGSNRWAMTERGRPMVDRHRDSLRIGPSRLDWNPDGLTIRVDERATPHFSPVRGTIRVWPDALNHRTFDLDTQGRHRWRPIAPSARVEVALDRPDATWSGNAYFDTNRGAEPLESAFVRWDWSRARLRESTVVLYDARRRTGDPLAMALRFDRHGAVEELTPPPRVSLPAGLWRVRRGTQADTTEGVTIRRSLEDSPFYTREILDTRLFGERVEAVHESLDLDRFAHPIVKLMLPFRMPRRRG